MKRTRNAARRSALGAALMIAALSGCDNVSWGGADVAVVPPPPKPRGVAGGDVETGATEPLPRGPVLYYVVRSGGQALLTPVAEIRGDSLRRIGSEGDARVYAGRLVAEHMRQGAEFDLFSRGVRVGTYVVRSARVPDQDHCPLLPVASGALELSVAADSIMEFLALEKPHAPQASPRAPNAPQTLGRMRFVAPILAERMLRARGAQLPANWQAAMEQVAAFPASGRADAGFAATFLVGDTLGPGLDDEGYALFFLAMPTASQTGWDTVYVDYREYPRTKKAAPRVIDYLDWTRDDQVELLVQVFGTRATWFEAIGRDPQGRWRSLFSDRCDEGGRPSLVPAMPLPAALPPDTALPGSRP
ncbi:MAG TPA: hypothetical protein VK939_16720 [Longimicrobiales bacterium]|nr:hypothetical protein [Longimicrobiales bacterium]